MSDAGPVLDDDQIALLQRTLLAELAAHARLQAIGRALAPAALDGLDQAGGEAEAALREAVAAFRAATWPDPVAGLAGLIGAAADALLAAFDGLAQAAAHPEAMLQAYRALRYVPRAAEALYPLAASFAPVNRHFLDPAMRDDEALAGRLEAADRDRGDTGIVHAGNEKHQRGGFSLYVPETYEPDIPHPLVIALHGGSGHGRAFLWSWLPQARSRNAILLAPTSMEGTWSLMQPERDGRNIAAMLEHLGERLNIDRGRVLLTGMSDGGTFSYLCGLAPGLSISHLAPVAASFQPLLLEFLDRDRLARTPVYLTHGALDWMFPVQMAREARAALLAAGADVTYRELADLSHTYPIEENINILRWFLD